MLRLIKQGFRQLLTGKNPVANLITTLFHIQYYYSEASWTHNTFCGYTIYQCPLDLQLYQEVLFRKRPGYIIQTGVAGGGSLYYLASMMDVMDFPEDSIILGVDIQLTHSAQSIQHPRIRMLEGNSVSAGILERVKELTENNTNGMVILDSDHSKNHVSKEIVTYRDFVSPGQYLVVEDTNINSPVCFGFGPGPLEAVNDFLLEDNRFQADDSLWLRNRFSFHQKGWLIRK